MADEPQIEGSTAEAPPQEAARRSTWIFVNRQKFPVHLPDPVDPGSFTVFPAIPDAKVTLRSGMYQTHPFFDHFTRIERSISKEIAPDYLKLDTSHVPKGPTIHDMLNMDPNAIKGFLAMLAERDPEMAANIVSSLRPGAAQARPNVPNPLQPTKPISQAPPGA